MRVHCFLEHAQFVLVQLLVHLGTPETALANDLDRTGYAGLLMCAELDRSKRSATNLLLHFIELHEVSDLLEGALLLEG